MATPDISKTPQPVENAGQEGLVPEEVVAERYCVKRRLGGGGMGEAWLAEDRVLHRRLVLKRLIGAHPADGSHARQLLTEAKRATAIDSPHIAQVYDVCSHRGEWLLAMEYIAGQDLRAILTTPLTAERYFSLAIQVVEAIQAAHAGGILHCDIKPENIMVTEQGFVKVLDFGLARTMVAPESANETVSLTPASAVFSGTPGYIAPEVLRESEPTEQSDIFSLGVVLYEMAGGRPPFRAKSLAESVHLTLSADPGSLDLKRHGLPEELNRILKKALMKEPERRYATVRDLLVDLRGCAPGNFALAGGAAQRPWRTAGVTGAAVIVIAALAAAAVLVRRYEREAPRPPAHPIALAAKTRLLAVLPFRVIGPANNGDMSAYSEGLREAVTSSLARVTPSDRIDVLAASEVRAHALKTPEEAHKELGADLVIDGSYQQFRNQVRILFSVIDASGRVLQSEMVTSTLTDPFALEDKVVSGVLGMLRLSAAVPGEESPQRFGTQVPAAYDAYLRGVGYLRDFDIADNLKKAEASFREATQADPGFTAAYAGLGETQWEKYQATSDAREIALARMNCGKALTLNANVAEAQICQGNIHNGTGQVQEAQQEFQTALRLDPQSDTALHGLARTWEELEKPEQAEQVYRQAIEARPYYWANYYALANFLVRRADYGKAAGVLERAVAEFPANSFLARRLGVVYFLEGQFASAAMILQQAIQQRPHADAYMDLGQVYLHQRQFGPAITALEAAARMSPHEYSVEADLADAYVWGGSQAARATSGYRNALALSTSRLRVNPLDLDALMVSAYCAAALGQRQTALQSLKTALVHAPEDAEVNYYAARVYARLGDRAAAQRWATKAVARGYSRADVQSAPDLQGLLPAG